MSGLIVSHKAMKNDVCLVVLKGKLNMETFEEFQYAFIELFDEKKHRLILDMSQLEYINSTALGILNWAYDISTNNNGNLVIAAPSPQVFSLLEVVGLDELLNIVPDIEFAEELFSI